MPLIPALRRPLSLMLVWSKEQVSRQLELLHREIVSEQNKTKKPDVRHKYKFKGFQYEIQF